MTLKHFLTAIIVGAALMLPGAAFAQSAIDSVMQALEQDSNNETTYTERRDDSHQLVRVTMAIDFGSPEKYRQLKEAFERERTNTVEAVKRADVYVFKFRNDSGTSSYILTDYGDDTYRIIKSWRAAGAETDEGGISISSPIAGFSIEWT